MAESKNFKPLAGNTYVVKFRFDTPKYWEPSEAHPEYGESWSYGVTYWESVANFKAGKPGVDAYWNTKGSLYSLLSTVAKKDLVTTVKKAEMVNENTGKTYPVYELKTPDGTYNSKDYNRQPAQAKATTHSKGVDTMQNLNNATNLMRECLKRALSLCAEAQAEDYDATFEDIQKIAVSLFIAVSNGRTIESVGDAALDEPPAHSDDDNDKPPNNGNDDLPF